MERKVLVNEITNFFVTYRVDTSMKIREMKTIIEYNLKDVEFVENLINTIIVKTSSRKLIEVERLKELLLELEKIRLDLEYKENDKK